MSPTLVAVCGAFSRIVSYTIVVKRFLALFLAAACALTSQARNVRILCLGDSITVGQTGNGTGGLIYNPLGSYRYMLEQMLDTTGVGYEFVGVFTENPAPTQRNVFHTGVSGMAIGPTWNNNDLSAKLYWVLPTYGGDWPDIIVFLLGINDTIRGTSGSQLVTNFTNVMNNIMTRRPKAKIFVSTLLGCTGNTEWQVFNNTLRGPLSPILSWQSAGKPISLVDIGAQNIYPNMMWDTVHPSPAGQQVIAQQFFNAIKPTVMTYFKPRLVNPGANAQFGKD